MSDVLIELDEWLDAQELAGSQKVQYTCRIMQRARDELIRKEARIVDLEKHTGSLNDEIAALREDVDERNDKVVALQRRLDDFLGTCDPVARAVLASMAKGPLISETELYDMLATARDEALEEAARLYEQINDEPDRDPMAVIIEYRDAIRALKDRQP